MSGNRVWGRRLKEAREAIGLSQRQLGIEAGLDPSVASTRINRYELGVHKADYQISQKLAEVLKVPVAFLYADDDALAEIILRFGRADAGQRERLMRVVAELA